ncbi:MAG: helix-turn-helix domain-containing protein [Opitutales bacterium]|nr:helix-turn-helix domain-containing protein [Opitutales bacterium]
MNQYYKGFERRWKECSPVPIIQSKAFVQSLPTHRDCRGAVIPVFAEKEWSEGDQLNIPWINFSNRLGSHPKAVNVFIDSEELGQMAADHLMAQGYHSFAYLAMPDCRFDQERKEAFRAALKAKGYPLLIFSKELLTEANPLLYHQLLTKVITEWLQTLTQPTAIFTCDERFALRVVEQLYGENQSPVWSSHSVLGVSDTEEDCHQEPPASLLSFLRPATAAAGARAAEMLAEMLASREIKPGTTITVKGARLVERESTGEIPSQDPLIKRITAWAVTEIDQGQAPRVMDLALRFSMNKRTLERHFRAKIGKTLGQYLLEKRLTRAAKLLAETGDSIADIAQNCGFSKQGDLNRHFRLRYNRTPKEFRKAGGDKQ